MGWWIGLETLKDFYQSYSLSRRLLGLRLSDLAARENVQDRISVRRQGQPPTLQVCDGLIDFLADCQSCSFGLDFDCAVELTPVVAKEDAGLTRLRVIRLRRHRGLRN